MRLHFLWRQIVAFTATAIVVLFSGAAYAAPDAAADVASQSTHVATLEARIAALEARLLKLEAGSASGSGPASAAVSDQGRQTVAAGPNQSDAVSSGALSSALAPLTRHAEATSWTERVQLKGDFRARHDSLDQDASDPRERQRIRARLGLTAKVTDELSTTLGLATGTDDPISRNQTLDGASSSKPINVEQAFFSWKPASVGGLEVLAGKFRQPFRGAGEAALVFDGDLNPEGLSVSYQRVIGAAQLFVTGSGWWIDERASAADSLMVGVQGGVKLPTFGNGDVTLAAATYRYNNTAGRAPYYDGVARGNGVVAGRYANGFREVEAFAEWRGKLGSAGASLFADWVRNSAADDFDTGYAVGATLSHSGFALGYTWKKLGANAVLGTFADSDFGLGGTDVKGHALSASYEASKALNFKLSWAIAEHGLDVGNAQNVDRLQLDMLLRY